MAYKQLSPINVIEGGTGATSLTDHAVLIGSGTGAISVVGPVASTGALLASNGVGSDPGFTTATYPLTTTANQILYSSATNTVSEITAANNGVLITSAAGVPSLLAAGTTGQVLTATTGAPPSWGAAPGDVSGPGSSTDNALARWDGTGGNTLQDSTVIVTDNGEMTNGSQPAFLAYNSSSDANVTGDGTVYTIISNTEVFDQNADYNNATGIFTAPVTGRYVFSCGALMQSIGASHTAHVGQLVASNGTYNFTTFSPAAVRDNSGNASSSGTVFVDMDASDTAYFALSVSNSTKTVGIYGGTAPVHTWFGGYLEC